MAAKKTKAPFGAKTRFVLGLPRELSAKEVVAKGKEQGIQLSDAHVYKIRSTGKDKPNGKGNAPKAARGKPAGKGAAASAGTSKRDFVLGFGADTTPAEILREAKKAGVSLSKAYVYTIRSSAGASAGRKPGRGRAPAAAPMTGRSRSPSSSLSLEGQFIDAALDMGLARANAVLETLRARLKQGI